MTSHVRRVPTGRGDPFPTGVFVACGADGREAVVRLTPDRSQRWRCSACGRRTELADCEHTFAVALFLAETELGLTRIPNLEAINA